MSRKPSKPVAPLLTPESLPAPESRPSRQDALVCGALLLWTFLSLCYPLMDTDFWWHLKTGEMLLESATIPSVDLFTYTDFDKPWTDLHWGFQLLVTVLYRIGGVPLVTLVKAAVITAAVGVAWRAGGRGLPAWVKALLWIPGVICISGRGYERPEMLTQLFLALWLWIASRVAERPRLIWLLPPLQLVWVNCHALFVLGLVVGAAWAVDAAVRAVADGRWGLALPDEQPAGTSVVRAGALVAVACLCNPYFEEGAFFPLTLYRKFSVDYAFYSVNIGEFRPPLAFLQQTIQQGRAWEGLTNVYLVSEALAWLFAAASFVWLFWRQKKWSLFRALLFAGFSHLAWKATRNTNIFAIVATFVTCENFAVARSPGRATAPAPAAPRRSRFEPVWLVLLLLGTLCLSVVTNVWARLAEKEKVFALGERPHWFIHDAARFAGQPGFPRFAFIANIGQAAVYTYHNAPARRIFMDGRLEVCTFETFQQFNHILDLMVQGNPVLPQVLSSSAGGELPIVILDSRGSRMQINALLQTPGWRLVFADRAAAVFLSTAQADELELPPADPEPLKYPDGRTGGR